MLGSIHTIYYGKNVFSLAHILLCTVFVTTFSISSAYAAPSLPSSADSSKVGADEKRAKQIRTEQPNAAIDTGSSVQLEPPPPGADKISLHINDFYIVGVSAYSSSEIEKLYEQYRNKNVPLTTIWQVADAITKKYRDDGYFIARAVVPVQELGSGRPRIVVIEGYVADVHIDAPYSQVNYIQTAIADLKSKKPVKIGDIEEILMLLNDLPQANFKGVLEPGNSQEQGGVRLNVIGQKTPARVATTVSNYGSKYIGPHLANINLTSSFLPLQSFDIGVTRTLPIQEMKRGDIAYHWNVGLRDALSISGQYSATFPGDSLRPNKMESRTETFSGKWQHNFIRNRLLSLFADTEVGVRKSDAKILGSVLSKDRTRFIKIGSNISVQDKYDGISNVDMHVTKGLGMFGASDNNDSNLSRSKGGGDFTKAEVTLSRLQAMGADWSLQLAATGQWASRSLPSAEEFGFGGSVFGRAYDSSEIAGDLGTAGLAELRYRSIEIMPTALNITPYAFYDIGKIWNKNSGQSSDISASSTGLGVYADSKYGVSGNLYLAKPLTKAVEAPLRGNGDDVQLRFQIQSSF